MAGDEHCKTGKAQIFSALWEWSGASRVNGLETRLVSFFDGLSDDAILPKARRIFYAAGPGNVIEAHRNWRSGVDDPSQMAVTYSSQFEQFYRDLGSPAYIVSSASPPQIIREAWCNKGSGIVITGRAGSLKLPRRAA